LAHEQGQDAGGRRVEGAGVAYAARAQPLARERDGVEGRRAGRLVDDEDPRRGRGHRRAARAALTASRARRVTASSGPLIAPRGPAERRCGAGPGVRAPPAAESGGSTSSPAAAAPTSIQFTVP